MDFQRTIFAVLFDLESYKCASSLKILAFLKLIDFALNIIDQFIVPDYQHIIHKQQQVYSSANKQIRVRIARFQAQFAKFLLNQLEPCFRGLFQSIKRLQDLQIMHMFSDPWHNKLKVVRDLHIYLLLAVWVQECYIYVHLIDFQILNCYFCQKCPQRIILYN